MMKNITVKTYNSIAKKYQEIFQDDFSEKKYYDKFLKIINGKKILDIWSWIWIYTNYIYEQNFDILGIDFSDEMLKIAKKRYPNISFLKMEITDIQLNDKYDGIVCANSLFHIKKSDINKVLNKFYELLVPEGKILFILLSWQGEWFQKEPLNENLLTFVNFYSMNEFSEILNKVWFSVIYENIETVNNSWELWHNKMVFIAKKTSSKSNYQNEQSTSP